MPGEAIMNNEDAVRNEWGQICSQLRTEVGEKAFDSWLKPLSVGSFANGIMNICVPTRFMRNWVITNYSDRIHKIWEKKNPAIKSINFVVQATEDPAVGMHNSSCRSLLKKIATSPAPQTVYQPGTGQAAAESAEYASFGESGQSLSVPLNPQYTFDNFVVGKTNEFAYAAARKVAESDNIPFNPLFLYSGVGLGKTHLMHAIAWHIKQRCPEKNIVYLSAEKFMYKFVRALRYKDTAAFKEQFRSVDVLMVDDVQFMGGKDSTQEEFFYTFNSLIEEGRQIIISADKSPSDLEGIESRLRSRLGCGLVADIHPTDFDLRIGILQDKAKCLKVFIHADMAFRAKRIVEVYGEREQSPEQRLRDKDKRRAAYHRFYTNMKWGYAQNYHITLDSGELGIDKCADIIADLYKSRA